jgi:hypothetical protein
MATDYLLKTPHSWYFRRVIPKTLRTLLGKSQIKKPLHTRNLSEARIESRRLAFESDTLFKTLQGDHMGKPLNLIGSNLCLSGVKVKNDGSIDLHVDCVSVGSLNQSIVHPREVFKTALASNAAALVLIHNHPSGDPSPSSEDIAITRRLKEAGDLLGIKVVDHVIVGTVSLLREG